MKMVSDKQAADARLVAMDSERHFKKSGKRRAM